METMERWIISEYFGASGYVSVLLSTPVVTPSALFPLRNWKRQVLRLASRPKDTKVSAEQLVRP